MEEPKETQVTDDFNTKADAFLDNVEITPEKAETAPEESSPSKDEPVIEPEPKEVAGDDQPKKSEPPEEGKETEEAPKGFADHPKWKKLMTQRNEARELADKFQKELLPKMQEFEKVTSSPEYVRASMKSQGYTDEAVDKALREKGIEVPEKPSNDVELVLNKLNLDPKTIDENTRAVLTDITKVADIILQDRLGKILPNQLKPIEEKLGVFERSNTAGEYVNKMVTTIKDEGILDFDTDVKPELNKFIDANPNATQPEVFEHFKELNHKLTIERLRTGKKKEDRDIKKTNLRQNVKSAAAGALKVPGWKEGQNLNERMDDILNAYNYQEG